MLVALIPILVVVAGLLCWALGGGKAAEAGRIGFAVGLFFTVSALAHVTVHLP